ncbi:VWA domain-containing protein [Bernardetia sp. OM2101]|uniref:vWA domain-containing protein n=1 Tax=Bernardetia sp. OM2101 TaxID=3344876 RepID=UPI0035D013EB
MKLSKLTFLNLFFLSFCLLFFFSCAEDYDDGSYRDSSEDISTGGSDGSDSDDSSSTPDDGGGGNGADSSGVMTAGEWNDLDNWDFWKNLSSSTQFANYSDYWNFFPTQRIAIKIENDLGNALGNIEVSLMNNSNKIWTSKTDNLGRAELWLNLYEKNSNVKLEDCRIVIHSTNQVINPVQLYQTIEDTHTIIINNTSSIPSTSPQIDISFVVDATGSMGDEIHFLKNELQDVIQRISTNNPNKTIRTSSVFYRDEFDEYVTKVSPFTQSTSQTIDFIKSQDAVGGGDYPEAVHSGLDKAIFQLEWNPNAKTKIIFLILDAPAHSEAQVIQNLQASIKEAAKLGIKVIPITASGINKNTEALMRSFSLATNSTYVFITNHSGIGNDHIEATVGEYEVEYLNNLMVRLVNKYAE